MTTIKETHEAVLSAVSAHAFDNAPAGDVGTAIHAYGLAVLDAVWDELVVIVKSKSPLYAEIRAEITGENTE